MINFSDLMNYKRMNIQNIIFDHISVFPNLFLVLLCGIKWWSKLMQGMYHNAAAMRWTLVCDQEKETILYQHIPRQPFLQSTISSEATGLSLKSFWPKAKDVLIVKLEEAGSVWGQTREGIWLWGKGCAHKAPQIAKLEVVESLLRCNFLRTNRH